MKKRYCNRCGKEIPLTFQPNEHVIYDCWEEQSADEIISRQEEYDLCSRCYKQFGKFMKGKLEE